LSATSQETNPEVVSSAASPLKKMNYEAVNKMPTAFLKRLGTRAA